MVTAGVVSTGEEGEVGGDEQGGRLPHLAFLPRAD